MRFAYIDETGTGGKRQPQVILVAAIVDEENVQDLNRSMQRLAMEHLGWVPADFEWHGSEVWNGKNWWKDHTYTALLAAFEAVIALLSTHGVSVAHATINKQRLHDKYGGAADDNAYRLALQFLLEKIDSSSGARHLIVADEAKDQEVRASKMLADLQDWGGGEVPGRALTHIIDSLHYVRSSSNSGVQLADMIAFVIQRARHAGDTHPDVVAALGRMTSTIGEATTTWREPWPAR